MNLPDEVFTHLAYMLHEGERWQWDVGDYIEELWKKVLQLVKPEGTKTREQMARKAHADLIRTLAEGTGADKSTLNDRQNMAEFFSPKQRKQYDMLSYSQLRACKRAGPEDWETWAQWSLVNGYNGKPAGVHTIRRAMALADNPEPLWLQRMAKLTELAFKIWSDEDTPRAIRDNLAIVISTIQDTKELA